MGAYINRIGRRYGRLVVVAEAGRMENNRVRWACECDCGARCEVGSSSILRTFSCGCLQKEATGASNATRIKHGHTRGHNTSPEWKSWKSMLDRCYCPSMPNYHLYGGRGIAVCDQWRSKSGFSQFYSDMGPRGTGLTLDRINPDGNYEPSNCRWATATEQSQNRRLTPEIREKMKANLAAGRAKMWSDPQIRERLLESRRRKKSATVS